MWSASVPVKKDMTPSSLINRIGSFFTNQPEYVIMPMNGKGVSNGSFARFL